jgi:hypothetical protein
VSVMTDGTSVRGATGIAAAGTAARPRKATEAMNSELNAPSLIACLTRHNGESQVKLRNFGALQPAVNQKRGGTTTFGLRVFVDTIFHFT